MRFMKVRREGADPAPAWGGAAGSGANWRPQQNSSLIIRRKPGKRGHDGARVS